jgi:hypothetical protein
MRYCVTLCSTKSTSANHPQRDSDTSQLATTAGHAAKLRHERAPPHRTLLATAVPAHMHPRRYGRELGKLKATIYLLICTCLHAEFLCICDCAHITSLLQHTVPHTPAVKQLLIMLWTPSFPSNIKNELMTPQGLSLRSWCVSKQQ